MAETNSDRDTQGVGDVQRDAELEAIQEIVSLLKPLDEQTRSRVIEYLVGRFALRNPEDKLKQAVLNRSSNEAEPRGDFQDIRTFTRLKGPKTANEMTAVMAYYLAEVAPVAERKEAITSEEIVKYFKQASFRLPGQPRMALVNAKNAGFLDALGPGQYRLNHVGYNLVVHSLPRNADAKQ